jgi:dTDP-4-amino-4,6-dideoxygalactose transaminase
MYYILLPNQTSRDQLMKYLNNNGIMAVFHYIPLHSSPMGLKIGCQAGSLPITEELSGRILRLPLYFEIPDDDKQRVINCINTFFELTLRSAARIPVQL